MDEKNLEKSPETERLNLFLAKRGYDLTDLKNFLQKSYFERCISYLNSIGKLFKEIEKCAVPRVGIKRNIEIEEKMLRDALEHRKLIDLSLMFTLGESTRYVEKELYEGEITVFKTPNPLDILKKIEEENGITRVFRNYIAYRFDGNYINRGLASQGRFN